MTAMDPERRRRLVALGELHDAWEVRSRAAATFDPSGRPPHSDYNLHYVDLAAARTAEDEFHAAARQIFGLDPVTGQPTVV